MFGIAPLWSSLIILAVSALMLGSTLYEKRNGPVFSLQVALVALVWPFAVILAVIDYKEHISRYTTTILIFILALILNAVVWEAAWVIATIIYIVIAIVWTAIANVLIN